MGDPTVGVKETKEAVEGVGELIAFLMGILKDGFQPGADIQAVIAQVSTHPEFVTKIKAAYEGANKIPDEVKAITVPEVLDVATSVWAQVEKILASARKAA